MTYIDDNKVDVNNSADTKREISNVGECGNDSSSYGAIFIPSLEGNKYLCNCYDLNDNAARQPITAENDASSTSQRTRTNNCKNNGTVLKIALLVLITVVFSAISSVATFVILNRFNTINNPGDLNYRHELPAKNNHVYIDDNFPEYTIQTKEPGKLMTMEEAINAVKDSVVEITTESVQSGFGGYSQYVVSGAGSGVIISSGGYIITNNHVIEGSSNITVRLTDGSEYRATLVASDSKTDTAVISITPRDDAILTPAVIGNSDTLLLGQTVIAIGNPLGKLGGTVTNGIISSLAREIAIEGSGTITLLQTNAAVSPGNSGGGLFDLTGRLIGIVSAKSTGEGVEGISFAIPINTAWNVAQQLIEKGYVSGRPALGVTIRQERYGYSIFGESYYQLIVSDASEKSELKINDIIVSIDGVEVSTLSDVSDIISSHQIGDKLNITVIRDKKYLELEITLVEYIPKE